MIVIIDKIEIELNPPREENEFQGDEFENIKLK